MQADLITDQEDSGNSDKHRIFNYLYKVMKDNNTSQIKIHPPKI